MKRTLRISACGLISQREENANRSSPPRREQRLPLNKPGNMSMRCKKHQKKDAHFKWRTFLRIKIKNSLPFHSLPFPSLPFDSFLFILSQKIIESVFHLIYLFSFYFFNRLELESNVNLIDQINSGSTTGRFLVHGRAWTHKMRHIRNVHSNLMNANPQTHTDTTFKKN